MVSSARTVTFPGVVSPGLTLFPMRRGPGDPTFQVDDSGAIFGRTDFTSISKGFGLRGAPISDLDQCASLLRAYEAQGVAEIWNIPISDQVTSPRMRRLNIKGHGVI